MFTKQENRWRIKRDRASMLWARVWYAAVKSIEDLSDTQLDMKFDPYWHKENKPADRLKMFEQIRRAGSLPSDGSHPKRKNDKFDLVEIVNRAEEYEGTASLFHSPFWYLLRHQNMDVLTLRKFIIHCLILVKEGFQEEDALVSDLDIKELGLEEDDGHRFIDQTDKLYQYNLPTFIDSPATFDLLALIGALFRDAYLSGALHVALSLENAFKEKLYELCSEGWMDEKLCNELFEVSKERIFRPNLHDDPLKVKSHLDLLKSDFPERADHQVESFLAIHHKMVWEDVNSKW